LLIFVDADCRVAASSLAVILGGFARSSVGVVAARSLPDSQRIGRTVAERSAVFSARMLHETKVRLVNHDFLPIGRLMAVRRAAWQAGADHRWPCDRIVAGRAKRAGWEIVYLPEATVYYEPVRTYEGLRADYLRTTIGQARLNGEWSEPLPPRIVRRAASASLRRDLLNGAAWLAVRMRLWGEQATGRMRLEDAYAQWDRLGSESQ
jgi:hypothetical protein